MIEGRPQSKLRLKKEEDKDREEANEESHPHNDTKNLTTKQHKWQSLKTKTKTPKRLRERGDKKVAIDIEFRSGLNSEHRTLSSAR